MKANLAPVGDLTINYELKQEIFAPGGQSQRQSAASLVAALTPRQRQIMDLVLAGVRSKTIAIDLGISQRTVENHRAIIMKKTCCRSIPALARLGVAAAYGGTQATDNFCKHESHNAPFNNNQIINDASFLSQRSDLEG